jgi:hypothetical protein
MLVAEDKEQEALKGEPSSQTSSSRSQPSGGKDLTPSSFVKRLGWYELRLMDAHKHVEAPRRTNKEIRPPKKCPYFMALMCNIIDFETSSVQEAAD